jgi:PadR family transcriptional regulator PadR
VDVVREFRTAAIRLHVLHHAAVDELHGAWMMSELREHGHEVGPGTLYPLLHRMEAAGLLVSRGETVDGRRRRLYTITDRGREVLADCHTALSELSGELLPS